MMPRDLANLPCPRCNGRSLYAERGGTKHDRATIYLRCLLCPFEVARVNGVPQVPISAKARLAI